MTFQPSVIDTDTGLCVCPMKYGSLRASSGAEAVGFDYRCDCSLFQMKRFSCPSTTSTRLYKYHHHDQSGQGIGPKDYRQNPANIQKRRLGPG